MSLGNKPFLAYPGVALLGSRGPETHSQIWKSVGKVPDLGGKGLSRLQMAALGLVLGVSVRSRGAGGAERLSWKPHLHPTEVQDSRGTVRHRVVTKQTRCQSSKSSKEWLL